MKIVYYSKGGKVKKFVEKVLALKPNIKAQSLDEYNGGNYVLVTPTYGIGEVPKEVELFLAFNNDKLKAVASSGNKVWGLHVFGRSGDIISKKYNVPLLGKFENQGFPNDIDNFLKGFEEIDIVD